jgi:hypothetical protein
VTLDANTGALPTTGTTKTRTDIFPAWYKAENARGVKTGKIDKVSGKLATNCTPPEAVQEVTSGTIAAEIPPSDPAFFRWNGPVQALANSMGYSAGGNLPTESDTLHQCSDIKPNVNLSVTGHGPITVKANVTSGTHTANKLTIYFDDQIISTQAINGSTTYEFDYSPTTTGSHTVKAVVQDAALYSDTDETTVSITGSGGSGDGPFPDTEPE